MSRHECNCLPVWMWRIQPFYCENAHLLFMGMRATYINRQLTLRNDASHWCPRVVDVRSPLQHFHLFSNHECHVYTCPVRTAPSHEESSRKREGITYRISAPTICYNLTSSVLHSPCLRVGRRAAAITDVTGRRLLNPPACTAAAIPTLLRLSPAHDYATGA